MGFFSDALIQMDLATQNAHLTSKIDDLEKELVSLRKLLSGNS
jgi:hypothetical protein